MSDYPNPNIHRGDGVSGRGLLISFAVIVAVVALLAPPFGLGGDPHRFNSRDGTRARSAVEEHVSIPRFVAFPKKWTLSLRSTHQTGRRPHRQSRAESTISALPAFLLLGSEEKSHRSSSEAILRRAASSP